MIPPEAKAKLEEMALKVKSRGDFVFMAGAKAAWKMATELAVKAERERVNPNLEAVRRMIQEAYIKNWSEETLRALVYTCDDKLSEILNTPKDEAEK